MPEPDQRAERTYRYDILRGTFWGMLEAGWIPFTLLVAIRHFHAPDTLKAAFNAAAPFGLLLTPLSLYAVNRLRLRPSTACVGYFGLAGLCLGGAAFAPSLFLFSICFMAAALLTPQHTPMNIEIYAQNYQQHERGKRIAISSIAASLAGGLFGWLGGWLLDLDIASWYPTIYLLMAGACIIIAFAYARMPAEPFNQPVSGNPLQNLALIRDDKLFRHLLISWMVLGTGNLMTWPIRTEYIANPIYGIDATNTQASIIVVVIPLVVRVVSARIWGGLFDRLDLITFRNLLNLFFIASILVYFMTTNLYVMALGSALFGVALGGGNIVWSLWVTKIAEREKISAYMSVHTACCGIRGMMAPFLGYGLLLHFGTRSVAWVGAGLITASLFMFWLVRRHPRIL